MLLHLSLACAYVQTYPASQANSPSLQIAIAVGKTKEGMTREELHRLFPAEDLVTTRIRDLEQNALVIPREGRYVLSPGGKRLALFFSGYRRFLGFSTMGG